MVKVIKDTNLNDYNDYFYFDHKSKTYILYDQFYMNVKRQMISMELNMLLDKHVEMIRDSGYDSFHEYTKQFDKYVIFPKDVYDLRLEEEIRMPII